jgi:SAM-dependent methyltransferase
MLIQHLKFLVSPITGSPLTLIAIDEVSGRVKSGQLIDDGGNEWRIVDFIPRFVLEVNYGDSFGNEWQLFPDILYQYDGYENRFREETRWPLELKSEIILEAGCGAGPFTTEVLKSSAMVISFDISSSVDINYKRNGNNPNLLIVQASIEQMPFLLKSFDRVFCFGVLQHTTNPRLSFNSLVKVLKSEGSIATDIYIKPPFRAFLENAKYFWRRVFSNRFSNEVLVRMVKGYVRIFWPLVRVIEVTPFRRVNRLLLFDDYESRLPGMSPGKWREFATLDIIDFLTPAFDYPESLESFKKWFIEEGLVEVDVHVGYNGLEGRAIKP